MPRYHICSIAVRLVAVSLCGVLAISANAETHKNIEYAKADDFPLHLDLYLPPKQKTAPPLIVWIHGGGWRNGSKNRCPIVWMAEKGYAVASVQYRLTHTAIFPAQIHDCKGAIRWLRAHADKYGYNAKKIGVAGISAGGHLVALLGTGGDVKELEGDIGGNLEQSSRVQAVLDMCGPTDFVLRWKNNRIAVGSETSSVGRLLGGRLSDKQELAKLASPASHVTKDDPPLLIFHGTKDPLVHPRQSEKLRDLYEKTKLPVTLDLIPGGGHVPKEFWDSEHREMAQKFFSQHLTL